MLPRRPGLAGRPRASNPQKNFRGGKFFRIRKNHRNLRMSQSRGFGRPRRSRSQHWNPGGASCLSSTSVAQMLAAALALKSWMLYSDSPREVMQNAVNESFWDVHGVEIGPCAFFEHFARSDKICPEGNFFVDWMLWVGAQIANIRAQILSF